MPPTAHPLFPSPIRQRKGAVIATALVFAACTGTTHAQAPVPSSESKPASTTAAQRDPEALYNQGLAAYNAKDYDAAITAYTQAIEVHPNFADALFNRALAYLAKNQPDRTIVDRAIADLTTAIMLKPRFADAYFNRGVAYMRANDRDKAIADFQKYSTLKPVPNGPGAKALAQIRSGQDSPSLTPTDPRGKYLTLASPGDLIAPSVSPSSVMSPVGMQLGRGYGRGNSKVVIPKGTASVDAHTYTSTSPFVSTPNHRTGIVREPRLRAPDPYWQPAKLLHGDLPHIPNALHSKSFNAVIAVVVIVFPDGSASVKLDKSSGNNQIDQLVLQAVQQWKWKPAEHHHVRVKSINPCVIGLTNL